MKRRQRRPVLELNQSGSHTDHLQNKRRNFNNDYHGLQNANANPLANLLCHYNSDSDNEESKKDCKLDDQVNNFFKEIQLIAPKQADSNEVSNNVLTANSNTHSHVNQQALMWRECLDESSGYPYYWHIETNEVTWEMPEELRYYKNNAKTTSTAAKPPSIQDSHWVDFSSVTYQQTHENIPEGMIPREVVARNRNRFICNENVQKKESPMDQDIANASDNESDDGKIEMITSYGSDGSDSDTVDENQPKNHTKRLKGLKSRNNEKFPTPTPVIQPQLPTVSRERRKEVVSEEPTIESSDSRLSEDGEKYLKNAETEEDSRSQHNVDSDVDFRISLVPGYDEDSDAEEESEVKQERKALFPIPQTEESTDTVSLRKITFDDNRIADSNDSDVTERKSIQEQDNEDTDRSEFVDESEMKTEEDTQKGNKFLDNLHSRSKFFQRKKRIAFDVSFTKPKASDDNESSKPDAEREENVCDEHSEPQVDQQEELSNPTNENAVENASNFKEDSNNAEEVAKSPEKSEESKDAEEEDDLLSHIEKLKFLLEKLKFLSQGKPVLSPVQMMSIQLQTLFFAWEAGGLEKNYLRKWLTDTSLELDRLEQEAAPPGWICQWDRTHKRYYYQNKTTGVTQWTYPDTGIAGGAEEMEICSTPPPTEQEETEDEGFKSKSKKEDGGSGETVPRSSDIEAPPPPQISNPSPPPPPRIYAEDLKKNKRKEKCNDVNMDGINRPVEELMAITELKHLENPIALSHASALVTPQVPSLTNVTTAEPLPPGVDLTEAPYEIPATALKSIIYGAVQPQAGTLYDAAARDSTVSILTHPAALVQEHYLQYPAYQHLHAPAAIVLPHKHSVQPAIQLIPDYTPIYTNHKVIEKPPVKTAKESLVSALDSFYNDIALMENVGTEKIPQRQENIAVESSSMSVEETKPEAEQEQFPVETMIKEKKRKRTRIGISKKHKEVSNMVAKWQKVQQNFENT